MTSDEREEERENGQEEWIFCLYMTTVYVCDGEGLWWVFFFGKKTTILVVWTQPLI